MPGTRPPQERPGDARVLDCLYRVGAFVNETEDPREALDFIRERLNEVRPCKRVWGVCYATFVANDLVGADRGARGLLGRNTQGVKLIGLRGDEILGSVQRIEESASDETDLPEAPADEE